MTRLREFALFFGIQFLFYGLLCWNYRAIAQARYASVGLSDLCCAATSFTLIKMIADPDKKSKWAFSGYVLGGACGSLFSVWMSKGVFGQ